MLKLSVKELIQKLKKEIPLEILELMPVGILKHAVPEILHKAGPIVIGTVTGETIQSPGAANEKQRKADPDEPEGLAHHFWR